MKKALISGITGQDGSYLAESLLADGYEVHGIIRRASLPNTDRIDHLSGLHLHNADLTDGLSIMRVVALVQPDEIYNLAAMSHVQVSFDEPGYALQTIAQGTLNFLEAIRTAKPEARFYQASSSEMYGKVLETPQNEDTPFNPQSPYACAKVYAHQLTVNYREAYGLHASCGILFNHESERRGEDFVTRKITRAIARIRAGKQEHLWLGNLDAKRDWGHAKDYVRAMRLMLAQELPDDYVIATGKTHSVREFLGEAFSFAGMNYHQYVMHDSKFNRPCEVDLLLGDFSKASRKLGWRPEVTFKQLVEQMVEHDLKAEGVWKKPAEFMWPGTTA